MKLALQLRQGFGDDDLRYAQQLGVRYVAVSTTGSTVDDLRTMKERVEATGLTVSNMGNTSVHNMPSVTLGLPDRDEKIDAYLSYLRALAELDLHYTTYAHMANGLWQSAPAAGRGSSESRTFDISTATGRWVDATFGADLPHGRTYSEAELWDNFAYFMARVIPVAEQLDINIGLHPDDPPGLTLGGVPRCIASSLAGYKRAFDIASSRRLGACLCIGTWLEGGERMGATVEEAINAFARDDRLWKVHFRNIRRDGARFTETFLDEGDGVMSDYLRMLTSVGFDGIIIADHVPGMVGDRRNPWSLSIGYMQGLMDALSIPR